MIRVVCDSTADLNSEIIKEYNIETIPLHIVLDGKEYRDISEITPDEIYAWSEKTKQTPKTSASSIEDAINVFEPIVDNGDEIIAFMISKSMSTTYNVFNLAADYIEASDKISVIDSANLSNGSAYLAIRACELAKSGMQRSEIVAEIEKLKEKINTSFVVSTLTYLQRGGRCSSASAIAGTILGISPVIEVKDGAMGVATKLRGSKFETVLTKYLDSKRDEMLNGDHSQIFIVNSGVDDALLNMVIEYVKELNVFEKIHLTRAGGVISSHCGPGTVGLIFANK